jgi:hypothetical protein
VQNSVEGMKDWEVDETRKKWYEGVKPTDMALEVLNGEL